MLGKATASPGLVSQPEPRKRGARRLASSTIITFHTFTLSFLKSWNSCRSSTIITFHTFFFSFLKSLNSYISYKLFTLCSFLFWKVEFLYHWEARPLSLITLFLFFSEKLKFLYYLQSFSFSGSEKLISYKDLIFKHLCQISQWLSPFYTELTLFLLSRLIHFFFPLLHIKLPLDTLLAPNLFPVLHIKLKSWPL